MARLVRQSKTYYVDASGARVPKGTSGAKKVREKSAKWYGQGVPGYPPTKRIPLATDRDSAQRMLDDLVRRAERGEAGLPNREAARTLLLDHLVAFEQDVSLGLASKGGKKQRLPDPAQVKLVVQRVRDILTGCEFAMPSDLTATAPGKLAKYLKSRVGRPRKEGGLSAQSAKFFLAAARRFARWMSTRAAVRADLFDGLPGYDPKSDLRHARREVAPDELARLIDTTRASLIVIRDLDGPSRAMLYLVAFATGYRAGELAELNPENFDLDAEPPIATLPARLTKNKKKARQPLPPGVAYQLREFLAGKPAGKPVWPGTWSERPVSVLRRDLKAANVPYVVETIDGPRYADFHALRHSYLSALAAAGVGVKELQELARHSDPRVTLGIYTHARPEALAASVARLQLPGGPGVENPLAALTRAELEGAVTSLTGVVVALVEVVRVLTGDHGSGYTPGYTSFGVNGGSTGTPGDGTPTDGAKPQRAGTTRKPRD
jgi:integrase